MSMRKRPTQHRADLWIAAGELSRSPGHPFYERLNGILAEAGFDRFVEVCCSRFYVEGKGRPSIAPSVYMRMLLIGYFEGLDSDVRFLSFPRASAHPFSLHTAGLWPRPPNDPPPCATL